MARGIWSVASSFSSAASCRCCSWRCWSLPNARSGCHGGGSESRVWVPAATGLVQRSISSAAFDSKFCPRAGLHGYREAAPPLLQLCSAVFPYTAHQVDYPWRQCRWPSMDPVVDLEVEVGAGPDRVSPVVQESFLSSHRAAL
jgi:hypothetical protein